MQVSGFVVREASRARVQLARQRVAGRRARATPASSGSRASTRGASRCGCAIAARCARRCRRWIWTPASLRRTRAVAAGDGGRRPGEGRELGRAVRRARDLVGPAERATRRRVPGGRLRLRHEAEHPAAAGRGGHRGDRVAGRRRRRPRSRRAGTTACSCRTVRATPPATDVRDRRRPRAARDGAGVRDLPGAPAARARARRADVQDAVRAPGREPAREGPADRARRDHEPQPRLRGRSRRMAADGERGPDGATGASSSPTGT